MKKSVPLQARLFACFLPMLVSVAGAHHAPTEFDFGKVVEIEGTVVQVKWVNPHVSFTVRETKPGAAQTDWVIEGSSLSMMARTNAAGVRPQINEKVRVAGYASRRSSNRLHASNLLFADGQELVFDPEGEPRWKRDAVGTKSVWFDGPEAAKNTGIFRVWSTKFDEWSPLGVPRDRLTQAAKAKLAGWNSQADPVVKGCEPVGVPMIMGHPYPIQFVQERDRILLRMEIYDVERVIHTSSSVAPASPSGPFGRSTGKWDGNTLLVRTDGINWPFLDFSGVPMSTQATLVERFTPTPDGKRLNYNVIVTDPVYLTEPVSLERSWVARADESVQPFNCKE